MGSKSPIINLMIRSIIIPKKSTKICQSIIDFSQPIHDPLPKLKSIITLESGCNLLLLFCCAYKTSVHWTEPLTCLVAAGNPELLQASKVGTMKCQTLITASNISMLLQQEGIRIKGGGIKVQCKIPSLSRGLISSIPLNTLGFKEGIFKRLRPHASTKGVHFATSLFLGWLPFAPTTVSQEVSVKDTLHTAPLSLSDTESHRNACQHRPIYQRTLKN